MCGVGHSPITIIIILRTCAFSVASVQLWTCQPNLKFQAWWICKLYHCYIKYRVHKEGKQLFHLGIQYTISFIYWLTSPICNTWHPSEKSEDQYNQSFNIFKAKYIHLQWFFCNCRYWRPWRMGRLSLRLGGWDGYPTLLVEHGKRKGESRALCRWIESGRVEDIRWEIVNIAINVEGWAEGRIVD